MFYGKYLKYKSKYLELKSILQFGGVAITADEAGELFGILDLDGKGTLDKSELQIPPNTAVISINELAKLYVAKCNAPGKEELFAKFVRAVLGGSKTTKDGKPNDVNVKFAPGGKMVNLIGNKENFIKIVTGLKLD